MLYALPSTFVTGCIPGPATRMERCRLRAQRFIPGLSNLWEFESKAVAFIHRQKRTEGQFDPRVEEGILEGYNTGGAFKIYIPSNAQLRISEDVPIIEKGNEG